VPCILALSLTFWKKNKTQTEKSNEIDLSLFYGVLTKKDNKKAKNKGQEFLVSCF